VPGTPALTAAAWARLAPRLTAPPRRGERRREPRRLLDGILWAMHTGASWREVPERRAPWHTAYDRYARWRRDGTWARILAARLTPDAPT
jgi:transposase